MTPRCGKCNQAMPEIAGHNHKHTCSCGAIWIVIQANGQLKWLMPKRLFVGTGK